MAKIARQTFSANGTFVVPAGVTRVRTKTSNDANGVKPIPFVHGITAFMDNFQNIWTMGSGPAGQLGNLTAGTSFSSPVLVVGGASWQKVLYPTVSSTGDGNGMPMYAMDTRGRLYGWGDNSQGELGQGDTTARSSPQVISNPAVNGYKQVFPISINGGFTATNFVLALDTGGTAWSWGSAIGSNAWGIGTSYQIVAAVSTPTLVAGGHVFQKLFVSLPTTVSGDPNCSAWGLDTDGVLWGWGTNIHGMLGNDTAPGNVDGTQISSPIMVLGAAVYTNVFTQNIAGAFPASFFLDNSQNIWAAGSNVFGQLGIGQTPGAVDSKSSPVMVVGGNKWKSMAELYQTPFGSMSANPYNTWCALDTAGLAWAWGNNTSGACGTGVSGVAVGAYSSPVAVAGGVKFSKVYSMSSGTNSGNQSFFGIDVNGQVFSWGDNADGILGVGDLVDRSSPTLVSFPVGFGRIQSLQQSLRTLVAHDDLGHVFTWGYNENGQTGVGTPETTGPQLSSPVQVAGGRLYSYVAAGQGSGNVFAITPDGVLYGWGLNHDGQLGGGVNTSNASSPTVVAGARNAAFTRPQQIFEFEVIPGSSIPISVLGANITFGTAQVGAVTDSLVIEYEQ